jgi:hypothetical protein
MTLPYLPDDCIFYIIKYLQNYRSTLFNCLLVNRFWCKATVPLLYADPFKNYSKNKNYASIILTFISCFNKTEILQLKNQLVKVNNKFNNKFNDEYKPLFEYLKYLKNFDYNAINHMIIQWSETSETPYYKNKLYQDFIPTFYKSIFRQCNNIEQLSIFQNIILFFPQDKNLQEFLSNVENNCLNLRKLEVSPPSSQHTIKEKLCTIIQKQNNLRAFRLHPYNPNNLFGQGVLINGINDILLSLEFQKHSSMLILLKLILVIYLLRLL